MRKFLTLFLLLLSSVLAFSQERTISGTVNDDAGIPIPYTTITETGTRNATTADANGKFQIKLKNRGKLVFTAVGFETNSLIPNGDIADVILKRNATELSTVTVTTALGFHAKRDRVATSQSTVKGTEIVNSGEPSVLNGLASKASGVQIVRSGGDPGASVYIQIRGQNSIQGTQPLFVVDGVPVNNTTAGSGTAGVQQQSRLNDLNPEDIASVDVLKSAAAAALYGSRAANGVVIITTKKGKNSGGKVNISLASTYSTDDVNREVPLQTSYGQGSAGRYSFGNSRTWGDKIADRSGGDDVFNTAGDYVILPDGSKRYRIASGTAANVHGGKNSKKVYDHFNELFHTGTIFENTLSFNGGDDRSTFYASLSNLDQKGTLVAGSDYHKKSALINADRKFGQSLKLSGSINYANIRSKRAQQGSNTSGIFLGGLRTSPDFDNTFYEGDYVNASGAIFPKREVSYRNPIGASTNSGYDNPLWILNRITSTTDVDRFVGNFEAVLNATSWLQFIARAGIDYYTDHRVDNFPIITATNPGGSLTIQDLTEQQFNSNFIAKVDKSFSDNFDLTALVGFNYNNRVFRSIGAGVKSFILPDAPFDLANSATTSRTPFNSESIQRSNAGYASANLEFYNQLFLELTGRYDVFSSTNIGKFYPSASLGWQFTKLGSLKASKLLSFGKLRLTYGQVGVEPPPYLFSSYFNPATDVESWGPALDASSPIYGGGYTRSTIKGNPDIRPEVKTEYEAGLDLRFWNDRISISGTYYRNHTDDVIINTQIPSTTGFTNQTSNAAKLSNRGFEGDFGVTWFKSKNASITTSALYSQNKNKVDDLAGSTSIFLNGFTGTSSRLVEGQPYGVLWGVDFLKDAKGTLVLDVNGFPQTSGIEQVLGDPNPDWTGAVTNTFRYKNFSLSVLVDHVQGGKVWNGTRGALTTFGTAASTGVETIAPKDLKDYFGKTITSGTAFRGQVTDFGGGEVALNENWYRNLGGGFGPVASQFLEDGTRTRLREVSLGVSIGGERFRNKTKFQSIDFSITGRNLKLWTDYQGIDPETNLTGPSRGRGLDYFNNPNTRSVIVTVRINY
ncbi:MAG: SusC/RagA family TonB-linked outer membrane protein [Bacteroidota bacterium]|nr:SusC/RagA family TonB-linked outer membrane protein [Bacteroidota bacterium]